MTHPMIQPFGSLAKREKVFGLLGAGGGSELRRSDLVKLRQVLLRLINKASDPGSGNTVAKTAAVAKPPAATADKSPLSSPSTNPPAEVSASVAKPPPSGAKPLPPESSKTPRKKAEQPKGPMAKSSATQRPPSPLPSGGTCALVTRKIGKVTLSWLPFGRKQLLSTKIRQKIPLVESEVKKRVRAGECPILNTF